MQSYVRKELDKDIIYLSPMHIYQRAIISFDIPDTDPRLVKLKGMERVLARNLMQGEIKFRKGQYVLEAMKKIIGLHGLGPAESFIISLSHNYIYTLMSWHAVEVSSSVHHIYSLLAPLVVLILAYVLLNHHIYS